MDHAVTIFGTGLSFGEIIALVSLVVTMAVTFTTLKGRFEVLAGKLDAVEKRNEKADIKFTDLERSVAEKLTVFNNSLNDRLHGLESRVTQQEVVIARMDEKLSYIHSDLKRLVSLSEKGKNE